MVKKECLAVIPARGGSKRIPKKNLMDFMGKPLISWTIQAALEADIFDRIVVSTDSKEILDVAHKMGVETPFLRENYTDDYSPVSKASITAINQIKQLLNEEYKNVVQLMPNCPLRKAIHIKESYQYFINNNNLFQISCFKYGWMNPWWAVKLDKNLLPDRLFPETFKKRSQDLEALYCPSGAIWIAHVRDLMNADTFYGDSHVFYPIDWKAAIDIDNMNDYEMAKAIFLMENNNDYYF